MFSSDLPGWLVEFLKGLPLLLIGLTTFEPIWTSEKNKISLSDHCSVNFGTLMAANCAASHSYGQGS